MTLANIAWATVLTAETATAVLIAGTQGARMVVAVGEVTAIVTGVDTKDLLVAVEVLVDMMEIHTNASGHSTAHNNTDVTLRHRLTPEAKHKHSHLLSMYSA